MATTCRCLFVGIFLFVSHVSYANPWGKDADLIAPTHSTCQLPPSSLITRLAIHAIKFHQDVISPADGPRSHFIPSSSQYTLEAIEKYGFMRGYMMGCDRLMRENNESWVYRKKRNEAGQIMKWDPVP